VQSSSISNAERRALEAIAHRRKQVAKKYKARMVITGKSSYSALETTEFGKRLLIK
jgi:hypothetical protein